MKTVLKAIQVGALATLLLAAFGCPPPPDNDDAGDDGQDAGVQQDAAGNDAGGSCPTQYQYTDWDVTADRLLVKACSPYVIPGDINVNNNATLTIEPGVEVRFPADSGLVVGNGSPGKLVATGTSTDPILFTSSETSPVAGAWGGIQFQTQTSSQTALAYVHVRYGGDQVSSLFRGCVTTLQNNTGRISITNSTFEDCEQAGVTSLEAGFGFASFTGNTFRNSPFGLYINADAIRTITGGQTYDGVPANQLEGDTVTTTATWAKQNVPWEVNGDIYIQGTGNPVLTIPEGSVFRFASDYGLLVGSSSAGGLVVTGSATAPVVFETSEAVPAAGSWVGIVFGTGTLASSSLSYATVKYAGQAAGSLYRGCVTLLTTNPGRVAINHTTVDTCAQSGFNAVDAGTTFASFANNTVRNAPIGLDLNAQAIGSIDNTLTFVSTSVNHIDGDTVRATALWKKQSLPWNVDRSIYVEDASNPILTIAAGSVLRFSTDEVFEVGTGTSGGLILAGSSTEPVILESRESIPTQGSWYGLVLGDQTLATTALTYTTIRYGGQVGSSIRRGCLTVQSALTNRISVNNSTFDTCAQSAVAVNDNGFAFVAFANNTLKDSPNGFWVPPGVVGSIAGNQTYTNIPQSMMNSDTVEITATWVSQPVPWIVDGSLYVAHATNNPVLTIQGPNTFRFGQGELFQISWGSSAGSLIVSGTTSNEVVFESSQPTPVAGSWIGLYFQDYTLAGATIDHAIIRHAGETTSSIEAGAINIRDAVATVTNTTFATNALADIYVWCNSSVTESGNTYGGGGVQYETPCP